jgi:hypothetical protein
MITYFVDTRFTDGGEIICLRRRQPFNPKNIPSARFCQRLRRNHGLSAAGKIKSIERSHDLIGNRNREILSKS